MDWTASRTAVDPGELSKPPIRHQLHQVDGGKENNRARDKHSLVQPQRQKIDLRRRAAGMRDRAGKPRHPTAQRAQPRPRRRSPPIHPHPGHIVADKPQRQHPHQQPHGLRIQQIEQQPARRDTDHALQLLAPMSIAQQQLLRLEFGDWARAALELPGVDEHPLGPAVASIAAMAHFWRSEIDEFVGLVERLGEMRHRRASDATSVGPEFVAALIQDGAGAAAARLDEIDLDADAGAAVPVAWLRSTLGPPHLPSPELVAQVARLAEQTDSPLLRAFWHAIVGSRAQWSGDFTAATEAFRTTIALARDLDAPYFTHWCVSHLCASGTMADLLTPDDLALITNALREQRDAGQLQDQWLVLHGAATLLARRGRQDLALDITAGIAASPWGETGSPISRHRLPTPQDIVEAELQSRTVRPLDELVDDVLTQLDAWRGPSST